MKVSIAFAAASMLFGVAHSVNMKYYSASGEVDATFLSYLEELYARAEDHDATTSFTDMFTSEGTLIALGTTATGPAEILALKQKLLPPGSTKFWDHFPRDTTVASESATEKTYNVEGVIQTTYTDGNCSSASYKTHFTVAKSVDFLETHAHNLMSYDDYVVDPEETPTDIPCTA